MTDTAKPVIGFIGLGFMGHGMAKNIAQKGYTLFVKGNRNRTPVKSLVSMGATEIATPREMGEKCDIIHLCLSNSPQVEATIRGEDGILASGKEGLIVIDTTTSNPTSTLALSKDLEAAGMTLVDAPLGKTPAEAEAGTLQAMVGASDAMLERIRPVISCWAETIQHTGPVGSAHKMKLLMNFVGLGYAALYSELLTLAAKADLDPHAVKEMIGASRMSNGFFDTFMAGSIGGNPDAHKFSLSNARKDMSYCAAMANNSGTVNVMGAALLHYLTHVESTGKGDDYVPRLAHHVAALSGATLPEKQS